MVVEETDNDKARVGEVFPQHSESTSNAAGKNGRQKGSMKEVKVLRASRQRSRRPGKPSGDQTVWSFSHGVR